MDLLNLATTLCIGLLIGTELAVSAFLNPVLWQLDELAQAHAIRLFARRLGTAMPFWYIASLLLLLLTAFRDLHQSGFVLLGAAIGIWGTVIVVTILFLVPINNRMARMNAGTFTDTERREHHKWDTMHRVRVASLVVAMVCFLAGIHI